MTQPVIVIGAGGHALVVADALLAADHSVLGFTDPAPSRGGTMLCGLPVLGDDDVLDRYDPASVVLANGLGSVGDPQSAVRRRSVQEKLVAKGWRFVTVTHPASTVSRFARVGTGAQIMAGSVVRPEASIGEGCIINTSAVVEHHVVVGPWVHVAPGAVICGDVEIGSGSHVGAGATVRQGLKLGQHTVIAAGAVVVKNFAGGGVLVGVPARAADSRS